MLSYWCHELSLPLNRVCTGQSSDSERARDQWQCAAVTRQVNLSFSFGPCISKHLAFRPSKHLIECIAILPRAQAINVFRACLGAQLTICAQK